MPATRSRTSTEAPEVAVEEKKTEDITEQENESEVKETVTEVKADSDDTSAENSSDSTTDVKPVDKEDNTNGANDEKSDTNGEAEESVENGSTKRKSTGDEAGDNAPDSTDITPKKAKLDAVVDDTNGAGEPTAESQTPAVETTA